MMKKIFKAVNTYYKVATLLGDMAHRAMYSLIPGGKFDVTAARWVAKGAADIIYYGTKEVIEELDYYGGDQQKVETIKQIPLDSVSKENINNYLQVLSLAKDLYYEAKKWSPSYGGKAWGKISDALLNITEDYGKLLRIERGSEEEEVALRKVIIDMNIFDGLSHNSGTMYDKMVSQEGQDMGIDTLERSKIKRKIKRIRDISELKDTKHLYSEIKDIVHPMNIYKDYETQIREQPDFYKTEDITKELYKVQARKILIGNINYFDDMLKMIISDMENYKNIVSTDFKPESSSAPSVLHHVRRLMVDMNNCLGSADNIYRSKYFEALEEQPIHIQNCLGNMEKINKDTRQKSYRLIDFVKAQKMPIDAPMVTNIKSRNELIEFMYGQIVTTINNSLDYIIKGLSLLEEQLNILKNSI